METRLIIARAFSLTPFVIAFIVILLLLFATFSLGHLPEYGVDPDPLSTFSNIIITLKNTSMIVLVYLLFISFLGLTLLLFYNWKKIPKNEKIQLVGIYFLGITILFLIRSTSSFKWLLD